MLSGHTDAPEPPPQQHSPIPALAALMVWVVVLFGGWATGEFAPGGEDNDALELAEAQSDWEVQSGTVSITILQLGNPVTGSFTDWTAAITFDNPDAPGPAGSADVIVSIISLSLGMVTDQAMNANYFDATKFPTAHFEADLFKTESGYEARGPLTVRDKEMNIVLPFALNVQEGTATMSGTVALNRLDFGVGTIQPTEDSLEFTVTVEVNLTATKNV